MSEEPEDPKGRMPTERKSTWRTAEERRMSDLARVLEWLERRQRKSPLQQPTKDVPPPQATAKEGNKGKPGQKPEKGTQKPQKGTQKVSFVQERPNVSSRKERDPVTSYRRLYGAQTKGKRLSMVPGDYSRDGPGKADVEIKDFTAQDVALRSMSFLRQSAPDPLLQDSLFPGRRSTLLRDWVGKLPDPAYDRRLKSLMDKGAEPKVETVRILKPEEVLNCRYLRLSKNNIRTLLKLCRDAGLAMDIHPHMVEAEIDAKMVFAPGPSAAL